MHSDCILFGVFTELKHQDTFIGRNTSISGVGWLVAFLLHERAHIYIHDCTRFPFTHIYILQRATITTLDYEIVPYDTKAHMLFVCRENMSLFLFRDCYLECRYL